jgi:hypothetical protein
MAMNKMKRCKKINRLTVGVSFAMTTSKSQTTPLRRDNAVSREYDSWQDALPAYLVPQKASQTHHTTMTSQAVQTKEHDEKHYDIGDKCDNGAESDAVQVKHTALDVKATVHLP